jgi:hypothetical protein
MFFHALTWCPQRRCSPIRCLPGLSRYGLFTGRTGGCRRIPLTISVFRESSAGRSSPGRGIRGLSPRRARLPGSPTRRPRNLPRRRLPRRNLPRRRLPRRLPPAPPSRTAAIATSPVSTAAPQIVARPVWRETAKRLAVRTTTAGGGNRSGDDKLRREHVRERSSQPPWRGSLRWTFLQVVHSPQCPPCCASRSCGEAGGDTQGGQKSQPGHAPYRQRHVFRAAFSGDDHPIGP